MSAIGIILALTNICCAVVFIGLSLPLYYGKVKMNRWYGVRVRKAFASEDNWYKINRYGAKRLMVWSVPLLVIGIACFFVPFGEGDDANAPLIISFAHAPLISLVPVLEVLIYARKL